MTDSPDHRPLTPLSFQVLLALADQPRHGYDIIQEIERSSGEELASSSGTVYLAIHRLEESGLLEVAAEQGRRRIYRLTDRGKTTATAEARRLEGLVAVARGKRLFGEA